MKSLLSLSIILLAGTGSALSDNILISPASQTVSVGQTFTLDINVDQIPDLFDYEFSLSFNPAVLAAQSVTEGALFANTGDSFFSPGSINNTAGTIPTTADTLEGKVPGVSGPGTLAMVQFTAIAAGTTSIDFSPPHDLILQDSKGNTLAVTAHSADITAGTSIPEPATLSLLALALMFGFCCRFRSQPFETLNRR
ncbi:MAG: PEP-CTERM sorting domain-containing protein [Acidobacteriaceae bacterium]|nr:PEP-CTERM sorting domain-containing protein [Acidobacteriaceae bacterium]